MQPPALAVTLMTNVLGGPLMISRVVMLITAARDAWRTVAQECDFRKTNLWLITDPSVAVGALEIMPDLLDTSVLSKQQVLDNAAIRFGPPDTICTTSESPLDVVYLGSVKDRME